MQPVTLLHLADIHIGMENYGRLDGTTGLNSRVLDFLRRMTEAIDYALAHEVDVCIFAGDAYKNQRPNPTLQREFARRIKKLADAGVPTILLVGNHDMSTADRAASSLDIFATLDVPNTVVGNREKLHQITCRQGQPLQVATIPYPQRSRLLTHEKYQNLSIQETDAALADLIGQTITDLAEEARRQPDIPAVLTGHFSVSGATQGSEQSVMLGRDVLLLKSMLTDPVWKYVALGHIHKHQDINNGSQPPIVYPGSLERIDFGEERETKGFVMVTLQDQPTAWNFVPVQSRKFTTIAIDVRRNDDPMTAILDKIDRYHLDEAVVRVILQTTEEQEPKIEDRAIQQALHQASYVAGIRHDVDRNYRHRLKTDTIESLSPLEALSLYFDTTSVEAGRKEVLLTHAQQLVNPSS